MKYLLILIVVVVSFLGCHRDEPANILQPATKSSGRFSIQYANGLAKIAVVQIADTSVFDLGDLRGTKNYYFILENTGQTPITNISLTSNDTTIDVSPSSIIRLDPKGTSGVIPIIKVTINHGTVIENGIGTKPLQAMGSLSKLLHIQGSSDSAVSLDVRLNLFSYLLNFDVLQHDSLVPQFGFFGQHINEYDLADSVYSIHNTGNIPLAFRRIKSLNRFRPDTIFIPVGLTFADTIHAKNENHLFINMNPTNTVFDQTRYHDDDYGTVAFAVQRYQ